MSKFIVSVFDNEQAAYKGSQAMLDLHNEGDIVLFAGAVISKDSKGTVQIEMPPTKDRSVPRPECWSAA